MSSISPTRPSRRAARRNVIVEESDEEAMTPKQTVEEEEEEEEFTPAPKRSPRKPAERRRRTIADVTASSKASTRTRRTRQSENIEPSQIFDPDETATPDVPSSPSKRASPRKRQSMASRPKRTSIAPETPELKPSLPTPAPSMSPEPQQRESTPLADITAQAINTDTALQGPEKSPAPASQRELEKINSMSTVLEKPMDIVIKSRAIPAPVVEEPTGPKPRMVISRLVMTNFKSYAGRQVVGPFHVSFSSVVGPNGSGKSNVIDSLLFVFGFRASKMRQGKLSALIHNSAQHQDLNFCEVEVHFQEILDLPGGGHEVMPDTQLIVSRKAFKNNSSTYYLNGRTTNFTTVTTLLREKGIDLDHKRFLILQGEVESIAQMKPKAANEHDDGLLEYLEDIIGTSKYKTPIEEAATEVETLNEVCVEKNGRVQHVEKEKNGLEDKKNKALAYIKDENELAEKQSTLYQIYIAECEDNAAVTQEAIDEIQGQLDAELEKHAGSEDNIKALEKSYKKTAKEFESMEKSTQEMVKELSRFEKESVKHEERRKFISNKQKKAEKAATTSRLAASEALSLIEKHTDDIERKSEEIATLEKEMATEEQELISIRESLKGKTQGLSDQVAAKQKSLEPWSAKINEKQSAIAVAQSELDILREKANAGAVALEEAQSKIGTIEESIATKSEEIAQRQAEKHRLEKDVRKINDALQKLAHSEPEIRAQISSARQKADEARASLASSQNQGNVLKGLMRLKDSGRIQGFHGRLGNLGTIDQKYDVAISTACPSLDNMVVDNVEVGQQCIDYLRKNNLGRANFILLDRLAKRDLSPISTPEKAPRLFDLVKPKDAVFAPAFYSVMQNTLVANDLEQANRIAYGARRWRVVTLDGQLIDVSGTMSGGGTRVAKGAMSSKLAAETTKEQVQKLELDRDELEKQFQAFTDKQRELEATLRQKQEEIPQLETLLQKLNLEVESGNRNLADAQKRVMELAAELKGSKKDDSQLKALEKHMSGLQKELDQLHAQTADIEGEIQALQDKIMEIGGVRLRGQKAKVDGLKQQINMLSEEVSSAEVATTKNQKLKAKHEKAKADAEKELQSLEKDVAKLEADVESHSADASGSKAKVEKAQEALEVKKEELSMLKKDLDQRTSDLNSTRAIEIEMRNKLEENQKVLSENDKKARYWQEKLSKLSLQDVADLEGAENEPKQTPTAETEVDGEDVVMGDAEPEEERPPQSSRKQLPTFTKDELLDLSKDRLKAAIAALEERTQNASIDLSVLAEYRRRCNELASRTSDLNSALGTRDAAKSRLDQLRTLRLTGFMTGFSQISLRLKEMYQMITMGGNAELELVDSLDPFSEGILFSVMPPKKSWKNISNLSGGEKTLSSLALVFALHHYKPTPLYVMDEIDAALDFRNVSIVASYIKERTKNAQFIVISLRNNMFELAERLVGIYKVNHMTKSVTVENRDYLTMQR
ncbi:putative nuclear condensin complex subunit smc4 [Phaeomoniella chlamydospora]|uniref:Structural maintenance of chromosomes protein n=1 Tax=Phaeomoniella chlamydospora TaxID=158046 RepID=A0A0G2H371_PHACM|nr:putative nuclear condensin complex subunit smc4 [Phaeomoniella chlamydospora]